MIGLSQEVHPECRKPHKIFRTNIFWLDAAKIKRAQKSIGRPKPRLSTIDRALDLVISQARRNRLVQSSQPTLPQERREIEDVYGNLEK